MDQFTLTYEQHFVSGRLALRIYHKSKNFKTVEEGHAFIEKANRGEIFTSEGLGTWIAKDCVLIDIETINILARSGITYR